MRQAERVRNFPKTGWRNLLVRHVAGIAKQPAGSAFLTYQTQTGLHLPFTGEWYVYWGGRAAFQNRHVAARDQRFAYDFLILARGRTGQSYRDTGASNTDYYCYGQPIFAPANGIVVGRETELDDNTPGEMNPKFALGNHVILDHGCGEFSFFGHFQHGTVVVRSGDHVRCGQLLGRCGNSGNSSEPHLHYHLQNSSIPFRGDGLPAFFVEYLADGKLIVRGEPVARHTVRNLHEFNSQ
jgi:murein DD-endopeptidase MepM/ murein hydrolase activator NlpD